MATKMHRLQISLPHGQARFLEERARLEGVSMAAIVRGLIAREAQARPPRSRPKRIWDIAGIAEDRGRLIDGVAVSERLELYLTGSRSGERAKRVRRKRRS